MKRALISAAALALAATAPRAGDMVEMVEPQPRRSDSDHSAVVWTQKPAPRYSATPDTGYGRRIDKARAKAKAASKARKAQRLRAKGKR